jgi:hypothetical protein
LTVQVPSRRLIQGVKKRSFLQVLGVDLGGGKGKKTAVATLRIDTHGATVTEIAPRPGARPLYDAALVDLIRSYGDGTLVCVDAPLTLPPCLRCQVPVCPGQASCVDPSVIAMRDVADRAGANDRDTRRGKPSVTPYTQRAAEVHILHERELAPREALGQGTGPLAARAVHLGRALADRFRLNENLIEVYPKGTLGVLGFSRPYKKHLYERETRAEILDALGDDLRFGPGVWRELCVQSDHLFDAVISGYTGYLWARDAWSAPAGVSGFVQQDGWIWLPPRPEAAEDFDQDPGQPARVRAAGET